MCGISGIYDDAINVDQRKKLITDMAKSMHHRGPDHTGIWVEEQVAFGHNRLKIIDLDNSANQPFEYGHIVLTFNGEIYNYIELKEELLMEGYTFTTKSDTEVVAVSYMKWGTDCVNHFVGMWAFAIWDKLTKRMFCSRDRFGIKPFYYIFQSNKFYFASETKALSSLPMFAKSLNINHVNRTLFLNWACYNDETFYDHIFSLPASCNLVINKDKLHVYRYWDLRSKEKALPASTVEERRNEFYDLFSRSVEMHSRADVTIGGCLSGGIDSSSIASMYCNLFPEKKYKTFTIYYAGEGSVDERPFADEVARKYPQIEPHYFSPSDEDIEDHYGNATYYADGPLISSAFMSQYFVMREARKNDVKVLLDGQGSDEYLLGYLHSFSRLIGDNIRHLRPYPALKMLMGHRHYHDLSLTQTAQVLAKSLFMSWGNEQKVCEHAFNKYQAMLKQNGDRPLPLLNGHRNMHDNFVYHMLYTTSLPTLLYIEDRNSMAFSIESRVPFLDHRLVEYAYHLPSSDKLMNNGETKSILRRSMEGILPGSIVNRKDKKAFVTPGEEQWLRGPLNNLLEIDYSQLHWLETNSMKGLVYDYKQGDNSQSKMVWKLASLNHWMKNYY